MIALGSPGGQSGGPALHQFNFAGMLGSSCGQQQLGSSPPPQPSVSSPTASYSSAVSPCGACKFLRRKCTRACIFAPYFSPDQGQRFANVHKIFGASNVAKLLQELPAGNREDAVNSLSYEADARVNDPIYGCVGALFSLQQQVARLQAELAAANAELTRLAAAAAAASHGPGGSGGGGMMAGFEGGPMASESGAAKPEYGSLVRPSLSAFDLGHSMHPLQQQHTLPHLQHTGPMEPSLASLRAAQSHQGALDFQSARNAQSVLNMHLAGLQAMGGGAVGGGGRGGMAPAPQDLADLQALAQALMHGEGNK